MNIQPVIGLAIRQVEHIRYKRNVALQRLYSTFARGWPGMGLVVLRLGTGIPLAYFGIESLVGAAWGEPLRLILDGLGGIAGILLIVGLWTPISGGLVAAAQLLILFSQLFSKQPYPLVHIFLLVLGAGLAMLGPGAWSIDARLFGRKRLIRAVAPPS